LQSIVAEQLESRTLFAATPPRPDHVVIVVEENRSYADIVGSSPATYLNSLIAGGASLTNFFSQTHASFPNYLAMFSGSTQGVSDDSILYRFDTPNLASQLIASGLTFTGYCESLPAPGYTGAQSGQYVRRHNPWVQFTNVPAAANQPFSAFPSDYTALPTVSFVVPNLDHDMHDGTVAQADQWLQQNLGGYVDWAAAHNSLLIVTWDEGEVNGDNQIATIVVGANVRAGNDAEPANHYSLLRTIQDMYGLSPIANTAGATPIQNIWAGVDPLPPPPPPGGFAGAIRGRVFQDTNSNGRQNHKEPAFEGVTVFLDSNGNGLLDSSESARVSAADGTYSFTGLTDGTYEVTVESPDGWRPTTPSPREVRVKHQHRAKAHGIGMTQNALLSGQVFLDANFDGQRENDETGLRRWTVYLDLNGDFERSKGEPKAKTDRNGVFTFASIPSGTYQVRVNVKRTFAPTQPGDASAIAVLLPGEVKTDLLFGFNRFV
jgi:acid phosphatase